MVRRLNLKRGGRWTWDHKLLPFKLYDFNFILNTCDHYVYKLYMYENGSPSNRAEKHGLIRFRKG